MDDWKPFFVCRYCIHGYSYSKKDVDWQASKNKSGLPEHNLVLYIELECAQRDCEFPLKLYLGFDDSKRERHRDRMLDIGSIGAACEKGHTASEPLHVIRSTPVDMIS